MNSVDYGPDWRANLSAMPAWMQVAADRWIQQVAADPVRCTHRSSQGARFWWGLGMAEERVCTLSISFAHIEGSTVVKFLGIGGEENAGPH